MSSTVSVVKEVSAPVDVVWAMVTDLPRMGEWSPENQGGEWVKGATGPAVGARFKGHNKSGKRSWSTSVEVNACDAPRTFSFGLMVGGKNWCDWVDHRSKFASTLGKWISGVADRGVHNKANMEVTLNNLAAAAVSR
jgi:hypothetical protein